MLEEAQAPIVWAGGGARRAADEVRALAEALDAPVLTTYNGKGTLPTGHPLHAGSSVEEPSMRHLVERADLCLALGTRFSQETTANWTLPDPCGARPRRPRRRAGSGAPIAPAEGIVSDVGLFCRALLDGGVSAGSRDGEAAVRAAIQGRNSEVGAAGRARRDRADARAPRRAARGRDRDRRHDGLRAYWAALYLDAKRPGSFVYPASGALGCGVPLALGHGRRAPRPADRRDRRRRRLPDGRPRAPDGAAEGLAFVTLVVNDSAYGILRNYQETMFGRTVAVELNAPDFAGARRGVRRAVHRRRTAFAASERRWRRR